MSKKWNSIIEVVVVIVILTIWIIWTYSILNSSMILSTSTENKIKAINIAREWIEAVTNIRDTNWIKFSSDYKDCWFTKAYDINCISWTNTTYSSWSYTLNQSWSLWYLSWVLAPIPAYWSWYIKDFLVYFDSNWLITQTGSYTQNCSSLTNTWCFSIFTREIKINVLDPKQIKISSIVNWSDASSQTWSHTINLETILTNWKTSF